MILHAEILPVVFIVKLHCRNIASGGRSQSGNRQTSGSRNQSRDSSRNREVQRDEQKLVPATAPKELSETEIEKKTKAIMDEYLHIHDLKVLCCF